MLRRREGEVVWAASKGRNKGNCSSSFVSVCPAGDAPDGWAGGVPGLPCRFQPPKTAGVRKASLSTLQQLYSQTRCLEQLWGRAPGSAGWGQLPGLPRPYPLREGAADHGDASAPGNPTLPKKGLFIPKDLVGEVITGRTPARENRGCGRVG